MSPLAIKIASTLRQMMQRKLPANAPIGVPKFPDNTDDNLDATYKGENLIDPGIRNMVTGSGRGPVLGGGGRSSARVGSGW